MAEHLEMDDVIKRKKLQDREHELVMTLKSRDLSEKEWNELEGIIEILHRRGNK